VKGVHRITPGTKKSRQMIRIGTTPQPGALTEEQREWNARVEARKAEKKAIKPNGVGLHEYPVCTFAKQVFESKP
jgi:hypothetical protein